MAKDSLTCCRSFTSFSLMRIDADTPPKSKIDTKNDVVENASPALNMASCWVSKKDIYTIHI